MLSRSEDADAEAEWRIGVNQHLRLDGNDWRGSPLLASDGRRIVPGVAIEVSAGRDISPRTDTRRSAEKVKRIGEQLGAGADVSGSGGQGSGATVGKGPATVIVTGVEEANRVSG